MLKSIIIDDDVFYHQLIESQIENQSQIELLAKFEDPVLALKNLNKGLEVDLIFLDMNMPRLNGLEVLDLLNHEAKVILLTSSHDAIIEGGKFKNVIGSIPKPVDQNRFDALIERVFWLNSSNNPSDQPVTNKLEAKSLFVMDGKNIIRVDLKDVLYFKSQREYVEIVFVSNRKELIKKTMKRLSEKINHSEFLQVHRSYIVNLSRMTNVFSDHIVMENRETIPIGRTYQNQLKENLNLI